MLAYFCESCGAAQGVFRVRPESLIALAERLKTDARRLRKEGQEGFAADLRYAAFVCRRLAAMAVAEELSGEPNAIRRRALVAEIADLWTSARLG